MNGRRSRTKGATGELEVLHIGQDAGFAVSKRSGMYVAGHDLDWPLLGVDRTIEIKRHASGQARLYAWIAPITGTPIKNETERLRRVALWRGLDALIPARDEARP